MTANTEQVKKTIRDLFNLAENDAAAEGEINNAMRHARRLLDLHHLSEEECRKDPTLETAYQEVMDEGFSNIGSTRMAFWEKLLATFVKDFIGSVGAYISGDIVPLKIDGRQQFDRAGKAIFTTRVAFYGPAEDVAMAINVYETLRETIATMARLKHGGTHRGAGRAYTEGFASGLFVRLKEAKRIDEQSSEQSRALIVQSTAIAKATQERALAWLKKEKGRKIGGSGGRSVGYRDSDAGAYREGRADGQRAQVSAQRRSKLTGDTQRRIG